MNLTEFYILEETIKEFMTNSKIIKLHQDNNSVTALNTESDEHSPGHFYTIMDESTNRFLAVLEFQNGPIAANGVNGITNESLLAILIHRTKILNEKFQCSENDRAIQHMEEALANLEVRTARRIVRNVEGLDVK
jgi:hypothetical protein